MLEIPSMRKIWCTIIGLKIREVMCQGNRSHSPTTARNSILPDVSLEAEFDSEPLDKSLAGWIMTLALGGPEQRAHWSSSVPGLLTPCQVLGACYLKPLGVLTCYSRTENKYSLNPSILLHLHVQVPALALLDQWSSSLALLSTPLLSHLLWSLSTAAWIISLDRNLTRWFLANPCTVTLSKTSFFFKN